MSDVSTLATAWALLRRECIDLKRKRNARRCDKVDYESPVSFGVECWRRYEPGSGADYPRDQWCAKCLERQALHERYRVSAQKRGAALRRLIRALEPTAALPERRSDG